MTNVYLKRSQKDRREILMVSEPTTPHLLLTVLFVSTTTNPYCVFGQHEPTTFYQPNYSSC